MKRKTRMYEPWGYQEENNYQGGEAIFDNDLESFFAGTSYNKDDNKIYFTNKDGEVKASLDVNEFVKSDSIIDHTEYNDGILKIYFTNGDVVTIDLTELLDENEFKDGLIVDGHVVKVLIDGESDKYVSVSENGIKVAGIEADIEAEEARAISAETALDEKIDVEIERATDVETQLQSAIEAEGQRAQDAESALNTAISNEVTRSEAAEAALSRRNDMLNDELDGEKTIREAADVALGRRIDQEIDDRIADVDEEEARAKAAEQALQGAIDDEVARATGAETDLQTAIDLKADKETTYTQEEVDELLAAKDAEIDEIQAAYNRLNDMVLDLYYATTYSIPADSTLDSMLKSKSGEAKLTEDITTSTIAAGVTAKNIVKLNLGGKTVTFTGSTTNNPAMLFRNKQQVNIGGSGTIDAGGRIAVEADGADCVVTLSGTMFGRPTYTTDRSGGELIYCYLGTINITDGIFKNTGEDKSFMLNCKDENYRAGTAKIVVTGGKFYDFNPADNTAEGEHTSFVPAGYHVEESTVIEEGVEHTVYTVKKD